ncbi:hypothetical protein E4U56_005619 [Claviceps arundinis]|uniref:Uncharacterized protein n=1 Tax=Claviceps arundinis TaxID=1623583 RepID=A0A9P7SL64_9HYPO|nr:hypothetical protein E4U56_005619 [Claviceps arundinis]
MKVFNFAMYLLAFGPGASALPEPELGSVTVGEFTYTGGDLSRGDEKNLLALNNLQRRCMCNLCFSPGMECHPYKCECVGNYGCYSCNGGRFLCQKGPGSGVCGQ